MRLLKRALQVNGELNSFLFSRWISAARTVEVVAETHLARNCWPKLFFRLFFRGHALVPHSPAKKKGVQSRKLSFSDASKR